MELNLAGKRALVTGAGRGLGRSIAIALAREGVSVAGTARTQADLESLIDQMGGKSAGHMCVALDLMPDNAPTSLAEKLVAEFGPLDIVVHNLGGTASVRSPMPAVNEWRRVWRLNVEIALEINAVIVPQMQRLGWGRVIHISSIAAEHSKGSLPYSVAKAAVNAYVRGLGCAVATDGVIVAAVMPGALLSKGGYWESILAENPEHAAKFLEERIALKRFGKLEEISPFVVFLCSDRASFAAGSVIPIDGGTW